MLTLDVLKQYVESTKGDEPNPRELRAWLLDVSRTVLAVRSDVDGLQQAMQQVVKGEAPAPLASKRWDPEVVEYLLRVFTHIRDEVTTLNQAREAAGVGIEEASKALGIDAEPPPPAPAQEKVPADPEATAAPPYYPEFFRKGVGRAIVMDAHLAAEDYPDFVRRVKGKIKPKLNDESCAVCLRCSVELDHTQEVFCPGCFVEGKALAAEEADDG